MFARSLLRWPLLTLLAMAGTLHAAEARVAVAANFAERTDMILAIPPEGTRSISPEWKSGFYHIAHTAGVPLIVSVLDYGTKTIRLAATFATSGDYAADLALIRKHYEGVQGRHIGKFAHAD